MVEIEHNLNPSKFRWLWAKYVTGLDATHHCTNCIRGRYSHRFSKHNPDFTEAPKLVLDEQPPPSFKAIYICGVASKGYARHSNYHHNVHAAIELEVGTEDHWSFENWTMRIKHGRFLRIPATESELPEPYRSLGPEYTTCRIFRWAVSYFANEEPDCKASDGRVFQPKA